MSTAVTSLAIMSGGVSSTFGPLIQLLFIILFILGSLYIIYDVYKKDK